MPSNDRSKRRTKARKQRQQAERRASRKRPSPTVGLIAHGSRDTAAFALIAAGILASHDERGTPHG